MKVIAVTGGKGGTGKSTVATALAAELGRKNKVLLVDADADCPNDHLLLGIERKEVARVMQRIPEWNFEKCTECGKCSRVCKPHAIVSVKGKPVFIEQQCNGCGACELVCPAGAISWKEKEIGKIFSGKSQGIDFLGAELRINEPLSEKVVEETLEKAEESRGKYDFVILDTAAGTHCDVITALGKSDFAFAVAEATPLGRHDLGLIIKLLKVLGKDFEIVLNKAGIGKEELLEELAGESGKKIFKKIPYSKKVLEAYSRGKPVRSKEISEIAEKAMQWKK